MSRRTLAVVALCTALVLLSTGVATAKKPVKPPPTPADSGTIYYTSRNLGDATTYGMDPDGTDKTPLATIVSGPPSHELHWCDTHQANERWFLEIRPFGTDTYENGIYRHELFAVSECGAAVRLTDAADIAPDHIGPQAAGSQVVMWVARPRWADGDTMVSYAAKRWVAGQALVVEWGFYCLEVDPDALDEHTALRPTWIPVQVPLIWAAGFEFRGGHANVMHSWAPDGESFIYNSCLLGGGLGTGPTMRADYDETTCTWGTTQLYAAGHAECWAPVADRILVLSGGTPYSMDPYDPTDITALSLKPPPPNKGYSYLASPRWSPSGTHIVFEVRETTWKGVDSSDVYIAPADGSDRTKLTDSDEREFANLLGWGDD